MSNNLKVAVRIRPLSQREINGKSTSVVKITNKKVISITNVKVPVLNVGDSRERTRVFTFDYCFQPESTQSEIFHEIENDIKNAIKNRYHSCVLTYGQSSSGKSHTMIGSPEDPGIIPRLCQNIFKYLQEYLRNDEVDKIETKISYFEIYNEKVRDLLSSIKPTADDQKLNTLRVREHPKKGPYVQGLSKHAAVDSETIQKWLEIGKSNRSIAATLTNPCSSRSHSVFTITFGEDVQLHLIDLAGSEKAGSRRISNITFKEGANINKSLVALGNVISTLAERGTKTTRNQSRRFIPYRDSVLTWLLKDTLGGNSKTILIATVSPSNNCYNETVNTLRFGQNAKKIVSCPVVNEDPKERLIRELRSEIATLKQLLTHRQTQEIIRDCSHNIEREQNLNDRPVEKTNVKCQNFPERNYFEDNQKPVKANNLTVKEKNVTNIKIVNNKQLRSIDEQFVLTMEASSDVNKVKEPKAVIRRASSTGSHIVKPRPTKPFGSLETISNVSKEKAKRLSQPSVLRKNSLEKSKLIKKPPIALKPKENLLKHQDRGVVTEEKGPPKLELRKSIIKPRSQIVAAVTSRLYGKVNKKEVATETEVINPTVEEVPKELTICSNARLRLQELTRQALKAHRRKTTDTQTDMFPVLRVKEMSTDVDDLKILLAEIRDAETETIEVKTHEIGINCQIQNFEPIQQDIKSAFVITKSCGTQSSSDLLTDPKKSDQLPTSSISFKKYLQENTKTEPSYTVINPCTSNPIYTSSVNFNVSHNYINHNRVTDTPSEDSLDDQNHASNICFPDIISNHNSLEHGILGTDTQKHLIEEKFASSNTLDEQFTTTTILDKFHLELDNASCLTTFQYVDRLKSIDVPAVHASQICVTKQFSEKCLPFYASMPKRSIATQSQTELLNLADSYLPKILNSFAKKTQKCNTIKSSSSSDSFHQLDSTPSSTSESEKIFTTMSKFMEEATSLMTNLTLASEKLQLQQSFDLEVTINGLDDRLFISQAQKTYHDCPSQTPCVEETSTQTSPQLSLTTFKYPVNKYEESLKQSCKRLEECINKIKSSECSTCKDFNLETASRAGGSTSNFENDYSLQSNFTRSDYSSLSRSSQRCSRCTPSAYLKQLTNMRKEILDYSKNKLQT